MPSGAEPAAGAHAPAALRPPGPFAPLDDPEADDKLRETPAPLELSPPLPLEIDDAARGSHARAAFERVEEWDRARAVLVNLGMAPPPADSGASPEPGMRHSGVSFEYPPAWRDQSVVIVREQVPREFRRNAVVFRAVVGPWTTLEWFAGAQLHELVMKLRLPSPPQVRHAAYGWRTFALATYRIVGAPGGPALKQTVAFHLAGDAGYVVTFSAREDDYDAAWVEAFEPILASFAFFGGCDGTSFP